MRYAVLFVSMMMLVFVAAVAQESASPAGNQADISAAPDAPHPTHPWTWWTGMKNLEQSPKATL